MTVTPHCYAKFGYAGYAKHGYSTWLCRIWLFYMVAARMVMSVTPYTVTPRGYAGYAKFGYATYGVRAG